MCGNSMRVMVEDVQVEGQKKKYEGNKIDLDEYVVVFGQEIFVVLFVFCVVVLLLDVVMWFYYYCFLFINVWKRRFVDFMFL